MDKSKSPTADTLVMRIASERFASTKYAREALRRAVAEISDDQLRFARGFQILVMA